ncbi:MAG: flippase-like domain-containing protein [Rhizobacter sp.]|nr:flippase-like domain-containing protein [Bacteriovorax sp.]
MIKIALKFLLAFALCYWLFTSGKLDFSLVTKSFQQGYLWLLGIAFFISHLLLNAYRFRGLLIAKSKEKISFSKVFSFDAVGSFFSVILPGAVAGDVIRFFYYKNLSKKLPPPTIASVILLDRFMGLLGLMSLGTFVCLFQLDTIKSINPALLSLVYTNIFLMLASASFIVIVFSDLIPQESFLIKILSYLQRWPKLASTFSELLLLRISLGDLFKSLILSILSQTVTIACFWALASPFIPSSVTFLNLFTIIPIGFIGASLPIAPAGLGVGHLFFESLFNMLHVDHGASLYNLFFIVNVVICLLGFFPYMMIKNELKNEVVEVAV